MEIEVFEVSKRLVYNIVFINPMWHSTESRLSNASIVSIELHWKTNITVSKLTSYFLKPFQRRLNPKVR